MIDISIVMPCLNESVSLRHCVANALEALGMMQARYGLSGEVVVADNGSTDGSQAIATELGARVIQVERRGYGAALQGGLRAAGGRFLVMGDCDGSYDFREAVPMIGELLAGADICMGSRFRGGIAAGAMPWKNRYIGNPVLTGILNLFYGTRVSDAHCGLRALTKQAFTRLDLRSDGMEFASEMVVKAALTHLTIAEVPVTLSPDLRDRAPHLRPWRDGWRHLRFLLMLSPTWLFVVPAAIMTGAGLLLFLSPLWARLAGLDPRVFGAYWTILGGALLTLGYQCAILGLAAEFAGIGAGLRREGALTRHIHPERHLDRLLVVGGLIVLAGIAVLAGVFVYWATHNLAQLGDVRPAVVGTTLLSIGFETILGAFLLAVIADKRMARHEADVRPVAPGVDAQPSAVERTVTDAAS